MRRPTHLLGGSVWTWPRWASDADHRIVEGAAKKKGAHSLAPSPFAATPQVRQGHGPPGHGISGSRAVRAFASHRRLEWDNRGGGFGSRYGGHQCW
ncbi:hypothetical protein J3F84DRAFT_362622 [Trichoderma pleuroticola]